MGTKMETFYFAAYMVLVLLSVGVVAFCVWILPALVASLFEELMMRIENFPMGWTETLANYFCSIVGEINEFLTYKADLPTHRRKRFKEIEEFISEVLTEHREVNEGRRMPVSISG